jgi:hypothetical protein
MDKSIYKELKRKLNKERAFEEYISYCVSSLEFPERIFLLKCSVLHHGNPNTCCDCESVNVGFDVERDNKVYGHFCYDCNESKDELNSWTSSIQLLAEECDRHFISDVSSRSGVGTGLTSDMSFKNNLDAQNKVLETAYQLLEDVNIDTAIINDNARNELKDLISYVLKSEGAEERHKCPTDCKNLIYVEDICGLELEHWGCESCPKGYNVPIEVVRDYDNKELITYNK